MWVRVELVRQIFQSCSCVGFDVLRVESGKTELIGEEHGNTTTQRCSDQFVRVGSDAFRETRAKGDCVSETTPLSVVILSPTSMKSPFPDHRCFAIHKNWLPQPHRSSLSRSTYNGFPEVSQYFVSMTLIPFSYATPGDPRDHSPIGGTDGLFWGRRSNARISQERP